MFTFWLVDLITVFTKEMVIFPVFAVVLKRTLVLIVRLFTVVDGRSDSCDLLQWSVLGYYPTPFQFCFKINADNQTIPNKDSEDLLFINTHLKVA